MPTSRDYKCKNARSSLDTATDPWGIKVNRVELKNIIPPAAIQDHDGKTDERRA